MKNAFALIGLAMTCGSEESISQFPPAVHLASTDQLELSYGAPRAPVCTLDSDCSKGGCCKQITNHYRQCHPDVDDACHLGWAELPPSYLHRWDPTQYAKYSGSFAADVITARVANVWGSGRSQIYKLTNGQYWEAIAPSKTPAVGDAVRIAPGPYLYNMDAGDVSTPVDLLGVMQLPVIADTEVLGSFDGMEQNGLYPLEEAGYWRVSQASASTDPRVILTSPNNGDFWLYTQSVAQEPVDPAEVYADATVVSATSTEFALNDGTSWRYMVARPLDPVLVGGRAVVYKLASFDDRHIDHVGPKRFCWHEGGESFGEWVSPLE